MLQEAAAAANNKHTEESSAKPKAVAADSSAAASAAANTETTARRVREWSVGDVCAFFTDQKLGEYNAAIAENEVDGALLLGLLARNALGDLGIVTTLHVLKIERGLAKAADLCCASVAPSVVRLLLSFLSLSFLPHG
jgi:hypothetical protein